jgi:hypothetical protein
MAINADKVFVRFIHFLFFPAVIIPSAGPYFLSDDAGRGWLQFIRMKLGVRSRAKGVKILRVTFRGLHGKFNGL